MQVNSAGKWFCSMTWHTQVIKCHDVCAFNLYTVHPLYSKSPKDDLNTKAYYTAMCLEMKKASAAVVYSEMDIHIRN